jgi:hypothetical protein
MRTSELGRCECSDFVIGLSFANFLPISPFPNLVIASGFVLSNNVIARDKNWIFSLFQPFSSACRCCLDFWSHSGFQTANTDYSQNRVQGNIFHLLFYSGNGSELKNLQRDSWRRELRCSRGTPTSRTFRHFGDSLTSSWSLLRIYGTLKLWSGLNFWSETLCSIDTLKLLQISARLHLWLNFRNNLNESMCLIMYIVFP